jgi:Secretion system C-terminal sorting domain
MKIFLFILSLLPLSIKAQNCPNWQTPMGENWQTQTGENWQVEKSDCPKKVPSIVMLFPNPAIDMIEIQGLESENTEGTFFDNLGHLQFRRSLVGQIDIAQLAQGIYFIRTKNRIFKFIKI